MLGTAAAILVVQHVSPETPNNRATTTTMNWRRKKATFTPLCVLWYLSLDRQPVVCRRWVSIQCCSSSSSSRFCSSSLYFLLPLFSISWLPLASRYEYFVFASDPSNLCQPKECVWHANLLYDNVEHLTAAAAVTPACPIRQNNNETAAYDDDGAVLVITTILVFMSPKVRVTECDNCFWNMNTWCESSP